MVMNSQISDKILSELLQQDGNNVCFECQSTSPKWASVNNGIFLCLKCSGIHRGLGVMVSFVRSINMDSWNEKQFNTMKLGGNINLKKFFENYDLNKKEISHKYKTKAALFYRQILQNRLENNEIQDQKPSLEEGQQLVNFSNPNCNTPQVQKIEEQKQDSDNLGAFKNFILSAYNTTAEKSKQVLDKTEENLKLAKEKIKTKYEEIEIQQNIQKIKETVFTNTTKLGEKASNSMNYLKLGLTNIFSQITSKNNQDQNQPLKDKNDEKQTEKDKVEYIETLNDNFFNKDNEQQQINNLPLLDDTNQ